MPITKGSYTPEGEANALRQAFGYHIDKLALDKQGATLDLKGS